MMTDPTSLDRQNRTESPKKKFERKGLNIPVFWKAFIGVHFDVKKLNLAGFT